MLDQHGLGPRSIRIDLRVVCAWLAYLAISCSAVDSTTTGPAPKRAEALETEANAEGASPTGIVVSWDTKSSDQSSPTLAARIQNTTSKELLVTLTLESTSPTGDVVARPAGTQRLGARAALPISYPAANVPVRSVGLSSTLRLVAAYQTANESFGPGGFARGTRTQTVFTPLLHVTFDEQGAATFRDTDAQARANALDARSPVTRLTRLTIFDRASGAMVDATADAKSIVDGQSKPLLSFRKGGAPSSRAQSAGGGQSP